MIKYDSAKQPYVEIENVRITLSKRSGTADWENTGHYLTIRAYESGASKKLLQGPDIPIRKDVKSPEEFLLAVRALLTLIVS